MGKYTLTEAHRAQLTPWADRWIANALSTARYTPDDHATIRDAVTRLYQAAGLVPPPPSRIVIVPSPAVARFAGGFAAAIWYLRKHNSTQTATRDATQTATRDATWAATRDAMQTATEAATWAATEDATWYRIPVRPFVNLAQRMFHRHAIFALGCAYSAWSMWVGGNQWSGAAAYLSFFRHVARLPLDYTQWDAYETLAHYGPRVMHDEFCLVSERPVRLTVDDQSRPHAEHGPFCAWSDGTALYAYHGVRVPGWIMDRPQDITIARIDAEENAEVKRVMIERYGMGRYLTDSGALPIHADDYGTLYRLGEDDLMVRVRNSTPESDGTVKEYTLRVDAQCRPLLGPDRFGDPQPLTARNAVASTFGLRGKDYAPALET